MFNVIQPKHLFFPKVAISIPGFLMLMLFIFICIGNTNVIFLCFSNNFVLIIILVKTIFILTKWCVCICKCLVLHISFYYYKCTILSWINSTLKYLLWISMEMWYIQEVSVLCSHSCVLLKSWANKITISSTVAFASDDELKDVVCHAIS